MVCYLIPTVPKRRNDVERSWEIISMLKANGHTAGFHLLSLEGIADISPHVKEGYENLQRYERDYGDTPIVVMLANLPIGDIDFLNNRDVAVEHVECGVRFAAGLPIGGQRLVSFHLNTLVSEEEYVACSADEWRTNIFTEVIRPALMRCAAFSRRYGIQLVIESTPTPEFGDLSDERNYRGVQLRNLRNPFYLTEIWGFQEIRESGIGIALDLCHSRIIYKQVQQGIADGIIFSQDIPKLIDRTLFNDVVALNPETDMVHINDGDGLFTREGDSFREGIAFGDGDIKELAVILRHLNVHNFLQTIEVNETDFAIRPNTLKSIEYLRTL